MVIAEQSCRETRFLVQCQFFSDDFDSDDLDSDLCVILTPFSFLTSKQDHEQGRPGGPDATIHGVPLFSKFIF